MKALVLSGGGAKGAYEVGALRHLIVEKRIQYHVLCGTSAGALNAAYLGMYGHGHEDEAISSLELLWLGLTTRRVYKPWFFGRLSGLWKSSFYDSSPLHDFVKAHLSSRRVITSEKKLRICAVELGSGELRVFDEHHRPLYEAVLASSAVPALFCPIEIGDKTYVDGAVRQDVPLQEAIKSGATEIDVIVTTPVKAPFTIPKDPTALDILERAVDVMGDEIISNDLRSAQLVNRLVHCGEDKTKRDIKIRILRPSEVLTSNILEFNPDTAKAMMDTGYEDAKALM